METASQNAAGAARPTPSMNYSRDDARTEPQRTPTMSDVAEQTNQLNNLLADAMDRAANLIDRIGAQHPLENTKVSASKDAVGNGPVDYAHTNLQGAIGQVIRIHDRLGAIGSRI